MKKLTKINFLATLTLVLSLFLSINVKQINADVQCDPYSCSGTNTYLKVGRCEFQTSACGNRDITENAPHTCPKPGAPGSCTAYAEGKDGCSSVSWTSVTTNCRCANPIYSSDCSSNSDTCGPYNDLACSGCVTVNTCGTPKGSNLGCCVITATPPPSPTEWCGDSACQGTIGETCSNCETDCGACNPPPGPYCGDNSCNNGETNCSCATDCSGTCNNTPSCSVSLSPSSVNLFTDSSPFNITANVTNIQNGNVGQVEFSKSNSNITMSPVFDTNGTPYQSAITPVSAGTSTITANVYMGGSTVRCSASATITITSNINPPNEGPDCKTFTISDSTVSQGDVPSITADLFDEARNIVPDGGFENGNMTYWPTAHQLSSWVTIPTNGTQGEGAYYARIVRQNPAPTTPPAFDPHAATAWLETGDTNVQNEDYTFKFMAKSHEWVDPNPQGHVRIPGLLIQTDTWGGDWLPWPEIVNYEWREFEYPVDISGGTPTSKLRVVLRPQENYPNPWRTDILSPTFNYWPIYYDSIKLYNTADAQISPTTVKFYYIPSSANPCIGSNWTLIGTGNRVGTSNQYEIDWNTSAIPPKDYIIAVNAADIEGRISTGNPGNCGSASFDYRQACNGPITVTACTPSCGGTSCGDTGDQPNQVASSSIRVNTVASGNVNLTSSPTLNITWSNPGVPDTSSDINSYVIKVWDRSLGTTPPGTCTGGATKCMRYTSTTTSISPAADASHGNNVYVAVRAVNSTCTPIAYGDWSSNKSYDLVADISGNIYDAVVEPNGSNICSVPNPVPSTINISSGYQGLVGNAGGTLITTPGTRFTYRAPYEPNSSWFNENTSLTLDLNENPSDPSNSFFCSCPGGDPFMCFHTNNLYAPSTDKHFYVTNIDLSNGPWWQAQEGNVYGFNGYNNFVPSACENDVNAPICDANVVIRNVDDDPKSAGIPLSGGTISSGGYFTAYDDITEPHAENTQHSNMIKENYDYFVKNVDLNTVQNLPTSGSTLTSVPTGGTNYDGAEVFDYSGNLTVSFDTQVVDSATKIIIFVDGNVTIQNDGSVGDRVLEVEKGGYFAIIASGSITFENEIGNACSFPSCPSESTNIDGVYVASTRLIIEDDGDDALVDNMFVGEGTFVGWEGINLNRSFDTTSPIDRAINNEYPTERFIFRPDFNENTPELLKHPNLVWQEVN